MPQSPRPLARLRQEIDRIDTAMHALLVERGEVVGEVIAAKKAAGDQGSAFRPDREAELMRSIVLRDAGRWPLDTPENIWRVLLATSTYTQVPYRVHADLSGDAIAMRESMRFHFGFTVPLVPMADATAVIAAVGVSRGDLGMFHIAQSAHLGAWWKGLEAENAPKIIARLPFAERADHPASLPVFVIARPQKEGLARETLIASLHAERWRRDADAALIALGAERIAGAGDAVGAKALIAHPVTVAPEAVRTALEQAGCAPMRYTEIGCHAARFVLPNG